MKQTENPLTRSGLRSTLLLCAVAAAVTLCTTVKIAVAPPAEEVSSSLAVFLSRIPRSFRTGTVYDALLFAAVLYLLKARARIETRPDGWTALLAAVFAVLYALARSMRDIGDLSFFLENKYQLLLSLFYILGHAVLFYLPLRLLFHRLDGRPLQKDRPLPAHPLRRGALIIFLCWLPWILVNYPGSTCGDGIGQVAMYLGAFPPSAHHPPLSTFFLLSCYRLGRFLLDENLGMFLYILLQTVLGAFVFSDASVMLCRIGLPRRAYTLSLLFFALLPVWGCYAQYFEKDLLYVEMATLTVTCTLPVLCERQCSTKRAALIAVLTVLYLLLRKNGMYELIPLLIALAFWIRGRGRYALLLAALLAVAVNLGAEKLLYPALGLSKGSFIEALSLPVQQSARYVTTFPDEITEEEYAALDALIPYEAYLAYEPAISDPVKNWSWDDPSALPAYFRAWLGMLKKHPRTYIEAALAINDASLAPVDAFLDAGVYLTETNYDLIGVHRVFGEFPACLFSTWLETAPKLPVLGLLMMAGTYTWLLLACIVQLLRRKRYSALLLTIPGIMNLLVCIAAPLNGSIRYALPLMGMTPLLLGWTVLRSSADKTQS